MTKVAISVRCANDFSFRLQRNAISVCYVEETVLDEQQFKMVCEKAMTELARALGDAGDRYEFESDMNQGAIAVEFEEPPAKFVISPNSPVRQIWVSAHSRSFKLDWDGATETFRLGDSGPSLKELLASHISEHLDQQVTL